MTTGPPVHLWDCLDVDNQKLRLVPTLKKDVFEIVFLHSGKCLDVGGGGDSNGAAIIQFDCHHGPSEQFKLLPDGDAYQIKTMHGKCVDVFQWKTDNGAEVMQYDCQDGNNQKFFV